MTVRERSYNKRPWMRLAQVGMASLALGSAGLLLRPERPVHLHADETYNETVVPARLVAKSDGVQPVSALDETAIPALPPALQPIAQTFDVPPAPCNCGAANWEDDSPLYVSAFGGASYFDTDADTSMGGLYGMGLALDLSERLSLISSGLINHYGGGTQYAGTIGGFLAPRYYGESWERFGGSIYFDQFGDSENDTYTAQFRYSLRYKFLPGVTAGLQYNTPLVSDEITSVIPAGGTFATPIRNVEMIQAQLYVYGTFLGVGYVDDEDSMSYTFSQIRPLTDRLSSQYSVTYDENVGLWSGFIGMQIDLTPRSLNWMTAQSSSRRGTGDIVRGEAGSSIGASAMFGQMSYDGSGSDPFFGGDRDKDERDAKRRETDRQRQQLEDTAARLAQAEARRTVGVGNCPAGYFKSVSGNACFCVKTNFSVPGPFQFPCP